MRDVSTATLDFALLAEYATVRAGLLTVVGGCFTRLEVPETPVPVQVAVCGRIRSNVKEPDPPLGIRFGPDSGEFGLSLTVPLTRDASTAAYRDDGTFGLVFAVNLGVPVATPGLHSVAIVLDEVVVRTLRFEVVTA